MARIGHSLLLKGAACVVLAFAGCVQVGSLPMPFMSPSPEQELEKSLDIGSVGDLTEVGNAGPIQVSGVGLVMGLDGTGGTPPSQYRTMLEQQLRKQKIDNTRALLDNPNNALVLVNAYLPPGCRKGELLDVEISLPSGSKATSLKGGILAICQLRNFENAKNINPDKANALLPGHVLAHASGPLIVGLGSPDDERAMKQARIWSGASSHISRPYYYILTKDEMKSAKVTNTIASRINLQFHDDLRKQRIVNDHRDLLTAGAATEQLNRTFEAGFGTGDIAKAAGKDVIAVRVPYAYRFNHERFLRVSRLLPVSVPPAAMVAYQKKLETILLDQKHTMRAALRLEALGKDSVPVLKAGLASKNAVVRFCCAESLAYLGNTAGIEDLGKLAVDHPEFRAYAILAMASLDESICRENLAQLMTTDDPELRSGAFRGLRLLDENEARLGESTLGSFALHKVAPESPPLVTFSTNRRAEIVMFGPSATIKTPVRLLAGGEFTVTAKDGDDRLTISRINAKGERCKQCALNLDDALSAFVDLGADYADVVDLLRNLEELRALSCPIREATVPAIEGLEAVLQTETKETRVKKSDE
jgi:flagellar basal body P-ring protein FlgI